MCVCVCGLPEEENLVLFEPADSSERRGRLLTGRRAQFASDWMIYEDVRVQRGIIPHTRTHRKTDLQRHTDAGSAARGL